MARATFHFEQGGASWPSPPLLGAGVTRPQQPGRDGTGAQRGQARAPRPSAAAASSQALFVEEVQILGEMLEASSRSRLAAADLQRPHERRIALAAQVKAAV